MGERFPVSLLRMHPAALMRISGFEIYLQGSGLRADRLSLTKGYPSERCLSVSAADTMNGGKDNLKTAKKKAFGEKKTVMDLLNAGCALLEPINGQILVPAAETIREY